METSCGKATYEQNGQYGGVAWVAQDWKCRAWWPAKKEMLPVAQIGKSQHSRLFNEFDAIIVQYSFIDTLGASHNIATENMLEI